MMTTAVLTLADGTTFEGVSFGAATAAAGEVVFNTGLSVLHRRKLTRGPDPQASSATRSLSRTPPTEVNYSSLRIR